MVLGTLPIAQRISGSDGRGRSTAQPGVAQTALAAEGGRSSACVQPADSPTLLSPPGGHPALQVGLGDRLGASTGAAPAQALLLHAVECMRTGARAATDRAYNDNVECENLANVSPLRAERSGVRLAPHPSPQRRRLMSRGSEVRT